MMFAYAAPRVPLTIIGPMQYLVPSINFTIGWVIYDEPMPGARLAGFALVWAGLVLLTLEAGFRARRARLSPAR
jgi:chloramphenicol-sensitive protein RarD